MIFQHLTAMRKLHGSRPPGGPGPRSRGITMKFLGFLIFAAGLSAAPSAAAQDRLPIFDTHVHYSRDAWSEYTPARIEELFREAGVLRALVSSTPDDGTLKLFRHMPQRVVPNLRPYRDGADVTSWSANQEVFDYVSGAPDQRRLSRRRRVPPVRSAGGPIPPGPGTGQAGRRKRSVAAGPFGGRAGQGALCHRSPGQDSLGPSRHDRARGRGDGDDGCLSGHAERNLVPRRQRSAAARTGSTRPGAR